MKVKVGFIGAGNMGAAIMRGIACGELSEKISVYSTKDKKWIWKK